MFDKYKKFKKIGFAIIFAVLIISIVLGVHFRSVSSYNEDSKRVAANQEELENEYNNLENESQVESQSDDNEEELDALGESVSSESSTINSSNDNEEESDNTNNIANNVNENAGVNVSADSNLNSQDSNNKSGETDNIIRVKIRISCASLLKSENYDRLGDNIKSILPLSGEILSERYIYANEGATVMDIFLTACQECGISYVNSSGNYISNIAGIQDKPVQLPLPGQSRYYQLHHLQ